MSRTWQVVLGTPVNRRSVLTLVRESFADGGFGREHEAAIDRLLVDPSVGRVYLIEARGQTVGFVNIVFQHSLVWGGRLSIVENLFLRPSHRGQGLAQRVLRAVIGDLENLGPSIVAAYLAADDPLGPIFELEGFDKTALVRFTDQTPEEGSI